MKKLRSIAVILLLSLSFGAVAQKTYTKNDVFTQDQVIWYGLDFSYCKFIGNPSIHDKGYKAPNLVVKYNFGDWNTIPMAEAPKYDVKGALDKKVMINDINPVSARNKLYNPDSLITLASQYHLNTGLIAPAIKSYTGGLATEGIGVCYFVECFDGIKEVASYYVVIFDIASRNVLYMDRVSGKPSGATLKNYWAGAFRGAVDETHTLYKKWKKEAGVK